MIKCADCPLRAFQIFDAFEDEEEAAMQRFKAGEMTIGPATTLLREGSKAAQLYTALSGMGIRYKTMPDGQRQVINFVMPGDFIGLQAGVMGEMQHSVEATTEMRLCVFDRSSLWKFMRNNPQRAFDLTWLAAVEEHMVAETLATVGQQPADARVAWALYRLFARADAVGLKDGKDRVPLPFRQQDLADAVGLSLVHTNRVLKKLRQEKLAKWKSGVLEIMDIEGLGKLAGIASTEDWNRSRPLI